MPILVSLLAIFVGGLVARIAIAGPSIAEELDRLQPPLASALRSAMADAERDGVTIEITSGKRTPQEQAELFEDAVADYGSEREAARWVMPPGAESAHLHGKAVDIGPNRAIGWLRANGARYGLCPVYANEPWHFELTAEDGECPPLLIDATAGRFAVHQR